MSRGLQFATKNTKGDPDSYAVRVAFWYFFGKTGKDGNPTYWPERGCWGPGQGRSACPLPPEARRTNRRTARQH